MLEYPSDIFNSGEYKNGIIDRNLEYFDNICSSFDSAPDSACLEKTYAIEAGMKPNEIDSILDLLELSCCNEYRSKDVLRILGRFMFVHFQELHSSDEAVRSSVEKLLKMSFRFICCNSWTYDDSVFLRLAIYNLLDIFGTKDLAIIKDVVKEITEKKNKSSLDLLDDAIERFVNKTNTITAIKPDWLYAYVYKARFGYIYCRRFSPQSSKASLPFTMDTYSLAYKGLCCRTVQNSSKVVALEIGELKRSSEYKPAEDSFLYNFATMKFE